MQKTTITSYINGEWQPASANLLPVVNPATEEVVAQLSEADAHETARAVAAAQASWKSGVWANKGAAEKRQVFQRIVALTLENIEELAQLECLNSGLPMNYLRARQLPRITRNFDFFADGLSQNVEKAGMSDQDYLRFVLREPAGVAALISPWNAPLALASTKIDPWALSA